MMQYPLKMITIAIVVAIAWLLNYSSRNDNFATQPTSPAPDSGTARTEQFACSGGNAAISTPHWFFDLHPNQAVQSLMFSQDGSKLVAVFDDGLIKIWSIAQGMSIKTLMIPQLQSRPNRYFAFSYADDRHLVISCGYAEVCVWDLTSQSDTPISQISVGSDKAILGISQSQIIRRMDRISFNAALLGETAWAEKCRSHSYGQNYALSANGEFLLILERKTNLLIQVYNVPSNRLVYELTGLQTSSDEQGRLLGLSNDGMSFLVERSGLQVMQIVRIPDNNNDHEIVEVGRMSSSSSSRQQPLQARFSPSGRLVAIDHSAFNGIKIWNVQSKIIMLLDGAWLMNGISAMEFSPDELYFAASGRSSRQIAIWKLKK